MEKGGSNSDNRNYSRPNQKWECGWTCDGWACRIGPSPEGKCQATAECRPKLECPPGETKGRWRCTRPKEHGGPCENGPTPAGKCSCQIPKCSPKRSLRAKRGLLCLMTVTFCIGILLVFGTGPKRWKFLSPGGLSNAHQSEAFRRLEKAHFNSENGCGGCHSAARPDNPGWLQQALKSKPSPLNFVGLVTFDHRELTRVDATCITCHEGFNFHQPNLAHGYSCTACHLEHQGVGQLAPPMDTHCIVCHNNPTTMQAAAQIGEQLNPEKFHYQHPVEEVVFKTERPKEGYTQVFGDFAKSHPEFQVHRRNLKDGNTLRFNHAIHFGSSIPKVNGHALTCSDCHKPNEKGIGFVSIKFSEDCQSCHSLQFDPNNPELQIPHGDPNGVRAFLRSLPRQYADLAARKGMRNASEQEAFSQKQMQALRKLFPSGEQLERTVFMTGDRGSASGSTASQHGYYAGCVYCHTPTVTPEGLPSVIRPVIPDKWMIHAKFNHEPHKLVSCTECHDATHSRQTADILLPMKANCISCHSPKGGASQSCVTCHGYHNFAAKK